MPFRDIIGHRRLVGLVARSIQRDTLPPSLILAGPEGVGKRLLALAIAQALNCPAFARVEHERATARHALEGVGGPSPEPPANDACGTCSACTRIARGVHPDVLLVEPGDSGSIKIDQVREIIDRAGYRPFEGRRRVVIIDEADALVSQAQNALLKTLEEPPPSSVFLLVTSRPDLLLATVRSRCPRLPFRALDAADVAAALMKRGRAEAEARAIAATADGSIGHALDASAEGFVEAREAAVRVLGQVAAAGDARRRMDSAKELLARTGGGGGAGDREQLAVNLRAMASLLRDAGLLSTRADSRALANPDVQPALERLSAFRGERGIRAFTAVDQALAALDRNAGVKIVADWLVLQL
jgi:DNA polymerase-3 subunit delta'